MSSICEGGWLMIGDEGIDSVMKMGSILGCGSLMSKGSGKGLEEEVNNGTGRSDEATYVDTLLKRC
jgi:hypothetical protein